MTPDYKLALTPQEWQDLLIVLYKAAIELEKDEPVSKRLWALREKLATLT